jgi:hypothetical protein
MIKVDVRSRKELANFNGMSPGLHVFDCGYNHNDNNNNIK